MMQLISSDEQIVEAMDSLQHVLIYIAMQLRAHRSGHKKLEGAALDDLIRVVEGKAIGHSEAGLLDTVEWLRAKLAEDYGIEGLDDEDEEDDESDASDDDEPDETAD